MRRFSEYLHRSSVTSSNAANSKRTPRDSHEIPRIAINQPVCSGRIDQAIRPIPVVLSRHQKLKLLYAENR